MKMLSKTVASYPLQPLSKNNVKISFCEFRMIALKFLIGAKVNRIKIENHINTMMKKILENGFLDAIKVFEKSPVGNKDVYESAEGAYRIEALKRIFGQNSDVLIPCLVLPEEYNIDDVEQTLETIVGLNKDNRAWVLLDYIKSWTHTGKKDYKNLYNLIQKYTQPPKDKRLSVAQVVYIFVGGRTSEKVKKLKAGKFVSDPNYERFCTILLDTLDDWVKKWGTEVKNGFHKTHSTHLFNKIAGIITNQLPVVADVDELEDWINKLLVYFHGIYDNHFETQSNKPAKDRESLVGLSDKMESEWRHRFAKFTLMNPEPKPKSKSKVGIDKFTKVA